MANSCWLSTSCLPEDFSCQLEKTGKIAGNCFHSSCYFGGFCSSVRTPSAFRNRPLTSTASICWVVDGNIAAVAAAGGGRADIGSLEPLSHFDWEKTIGLLQSDTEFNCAADVLAASNFPDHLIDWPWNWMRRGQQISGNCSVLLPPLLHRIWRLGFIVPIAITYN